MEQKIPVSVGVLTFNSGKVLERCLESVKDFGQIIICDGGSTDDTLAIAKRFGATIIEQSDQFKNPNNTIADFSGVRNQMLDCSKFDWFLFVDSDEYLSEESRDEIAEIVTDANTTHGAYWLPRKRVYEDKVVECTTTYPSYQMRFFKRSDATQFIKAVHERIELKKDTTVGYLKHPEYVPFEFTKDAWRKKLSYYIDIEVERHAKHPFSKWLHLVVNSAKVSVLYILRHIRNILFCRGHTMPLWYELMQHWYHWQLIVRTGKKYFVKKR